MKVKTCPRCMTIKPVADFYANKKSKDGLRSECKDCSSHSWRKQTYGIGQDEYDSLLKLQGGICKICGGIQRGTKPKALCVDHCHVTGRVRGLLCDGCNTALGSLEDDIDRARNAIKYLENDARSVVLSR